MPSKKRERERKNEWAAAAPSAVCVWGPAGRKRERLGEGARTFNRLDEALEY